MSTRESEKDQLIKRKDVAQQFSESSCQKQEVKIEESLIEYKLTVYEYVWRVIFVALIIAGCVAAEKVYKFHNSPLTLDIPKGSIYDFWISIVTAIIIGNIRYYIKYFLIDKVVCLLSEKRSRTLEEGRKRADQLCKWLFDAVYYSITSICGYLILKDTPFLPPSLGGSGDCENLFMDYPRVPEVPYLKIFYLIQTGTHLYTFLHQLIIKFNDPKYYEYTLHHGLAIFLLWFSYMMNNLIIGSVVLLLHDPGDVFLIIGRAYTDFKNRNLIINIIIAIMSYIIWVYTRNIIYPTCVVKTAFEKVFGNPEFYQSEVLFVPLAAMVFMLSSLTIMHTYWTFFITKAALVLIRKGQDKNGYDS